MRPLRAATPTAPAAAVVGEAKALWTVDEVCRYLGFSKRWLHERTRRGEVPCYRFGAALRFDPDEIAAWAATFHRSPEAATASAGSSR